MAPQPYPIGGTRHTRPAVVFAGGLLGAAFLLLVVLSASGEHAHADSDSSGRGECHDAATSQDCGDRLAGPQQSTADEELAAKYAPIVYLREQQEECDSGGEAYDPASVEIVLDNPAVTLRRDARGRPVEVESPGAKDLFDKDINFFLDFPGDPRLPGCTYEKDYRELRGDHPSLAYAHIVTEPGFSGLALQYWFFYYFNDWNNNHEGDWEMIQIAFDADTAAGALQQEPARLAYAQHGGGETASWDDGKVDKEDGRPVVYVAKGSHASQYQPGVYLGLGEEDTGFGCDDASSPLRRVALEARLVPDQAPDPASPFAWIAFEGRWGEKGPPHLSGPTGPNAKEKWDRPFTWEQGLRSSSVRVPGGDTLGPNAVEGVCNVIRVSSALLSLFRKWPFIVGGGAGLVFLTGVGLILVGQATSRTRTALPLAAAPEPLRQRRYLGQILRAAASIYRRNLRVLLGIAAVFIPLGVASIGVQAIVFANPPAEPALELFNNHPASRALLALTFGGLQSAVAFVFVASAVIAALGEMEAGRPCDFRRAYGIVLSRFWSLAGARLRAVFHVGLFALSVVGIPWAIQRSVRWYFLEQAVILEGASAREALSTSGTVVAGSWWRTFGVTFLLGAVGVLTGPVLAVTLLVLTSAPLDLVNAVSGLVHAALLPFVAISATLLYFDLKARKGA